MGYAIRWAAMKDAKLRVMRLELGVNPTGERAEIPESKLAGAELRSGCSLVFLNRSTFNERHLRQLSVSCAVNSYFGEEHVMFSYASAGKYGDRLWPATHGSNRGKAPLEIEGPAPVQWEEIKKKLLAEQIAGSGEQAEVNFLFHTPVQLAQELPGFRVEEEVLGGSGDFFQVPEPDKKKNHTGGGWLGRQVSKKDKE